MSKPKKSAKPLQMLLLILLILLMIVSFSVSFIPIGNAQGTMSPAPSQGYVSDAPVG